MYINVQYLWFLQLEVLASPVFFYHSCIFLWVNRAQLFLEVRGRMRGSRHKLKPGKFR